MITERDDELISEEEYGQFLDDEIDRELEKNIKVKLLYKKLWGD